MAEPRRPQAPARPAPPAPRGATRQRDTAQDPRTGAAGKRPAATKRPAAAKRSAAAKRATPADARNSADQASRASAPSRVKAATARTTLVARVKQAVTRTDDRTHGRAASAHVSHATPHASSTLSAHRPGAGSVPTPWAKVAAGSAATVTHRMQERLRERRTARTRLLALRWGKRAAIALGAAGVVWLVLLSPVFAFDSEKIDASGFGSVVDPAEVDAIVAAHHGTSLAMLDTGGIETALEELVGVRDASVLRVWPAGLRVEIASSEPVAAIPSDGGGFALVDDGGEHVDSAQEPPADLPVVTIPIVSGETRILEGVLDVIDELPVALRDRVQGVEAKTEDSIHFVLRDGPKVEWGSGEQSALKAQVLQVLLDSPEGSKADVIDVSAPSLPITRNE